MKYQFAEVDDYSVSPTDMIYTLLDKFERTQSCQLLVVSESRLIGVVSDGDVRRSLIERDDIGTLNAKACMNSDPFVLVGERTEDFSDKDIFEYARKDNVRLIPIVNSTDKLIGVIQLIEDKIFIGKNVTALIMAGGFGTRLGSLTKEVPKPMVPIHGKPLIWFALQNLINAGVTQFLVSLHYRGEQIKDYLGDGSKFGVRINYVEEDKPLGTAGCLALLKHTDVSTQHLLVINSDLISDVSLENMLTAHRSSGAAATLASIPYQIQIPFGVVESDPNGYLDCFSEKPTFNYWVNTGIYLLETVNAVGAFPAREMSMPDFLYLLKDSGKKVHVYRSLSQWLDVGQVATYEKIIN